MAGGKSKGLLSVNNFKLTKNLLQDSLDLVQNLYMNGRYPLSMQLTNFPGTACEYA